MPYIGVRHVLKTAGLLKHQERISSELGVETISDLIELKEVDLAQLGLQEHWPKFADTLHTTLRSGAGRSKFAERRRAASEQILAAGSAKNGTIPLTLYLAAAGASLYADRLDALGVLSPPDLAMLSRADLTEMGMQILHMRRFHTAARLAPRIDVGVVASTFNDQTRAAEAAGPPSAERDGRLLCTALLQPLGLGAYCTALASRLQNGDGASATAGPATSSPHSTLITRICALHTADLEAIEMRLIARRRLRAAARALCPAPPARALPAAGSAAADGSVDRPLWTPTKVGDSHVLDGCRHIFLDVGANVGINAAYLYRWKAPYHRAHPSPRHTPHARPLRSAHLRTLRTPPACEQSHGHMRVCVCVCVCAEYRHGSVQPLFDRFFGHTKAARRASVCAIGIEANPNHAPSLVQVSIALSPGPTRRPCP